MPRLLPARIQPLTPALLALLGSLGLFLASAGPAAPTPVGAPVASVDLAPTPEQGAASRALAVRLERAHYLGLDLDDALSERLYEHYLRFLDPSRLYLLASDVATFEPLRADLDDALRRGDLDPAYRIYNLYQQRQVARLEQVVATLEGEGALAELPFGPDQTLQVDRSEAPWGADADELQRLWDKRLAAQVLDLQLAGREGDEARTILLERYRDQLRRAGQIKGEDVFLLFMNALTSSYDPHTQYLVPRLAENFDMSMSLSLEGIGALLRPDGEYARVERLIAAGPAEKGGELQAGDRIVGVAQDLDGEMVDTIGWRLDDVVALVRGPKGSVVRLLVLAADAPEGAPPREIVITRDEVKLEEQAASKEIVELEHAGRSLRLGVVELPAFYSDMEAASRGESDFRSSTRDVERLLGELTAEAVDGVVIDLRGNGGGSLVEAYELSGLVLGRKPVVQVRDADGQVQVLRGQGEAVWNGPLVVLVDRLSASASEIVAAAVQDHGRGVVVGEDTFGKGTVQAVQRAADGRLLVTVAKFYRVTGASTQHAGVTPDLLLPAIHDPDEVGESALDNPLPWDVIEGLPLRKKVDLVGPLLGELRRRHEERAPADPDLQRLERELALVREARDAQVLSLDLETRRAEQDDFDSRRKAILADWRAAKGLPEPDQDEGGGPADEEPLAADEGLPAGHPAVAGDPDLQALAGGDEDDGTSDGTARARDPRVDAWRQEALRILADLAGLLQQEVAIQR